MNDNMELINVTVYEPTNSLFGKKSDKAEASYFYCSSKDSCSYFANNECLNVANLFRGSCPFGKRRTVTGYTPRARSYRKWIEEIRDKNREHLYALKRARDAVGFVGEWVCLPYAHMSLDNKLFKRPSGFCSSGEPFIHIEDWNVETAYALISRRPQAMMGGEIKSYRSEVVPKFCKDLQDLVPEFYNDLITSHPDVKCITESYSYVGRKALIHSLRAGVEIKKGMILGFGMVRS